MAFEDRVYAQSQPRAEAAQYDEGLRRYMLGVYNYMASGVLLTGIVAWLVANLDPVKAIFFNQVAPGAYAPNLLTWIVMFGTLGMVFFLSFRVHRIKPATAQALFWLYAGLNGVWLSAILMAYTGESVARTFFIATGMFAALSLWGYTTKRNLSGLGTFLFMGLIGLIVAMVVNIFLQSSTMQFVISGAGILIFAGLTAYDTQKIKETYYAVAGDAAMAARASVMGALALYLDFINLFIMLLQFFGNRE